MLDRSGHKKMMLCGGLAYVVGWAVYCLTPGLNGLWVAPDDGLGKGCYFLVFVPTIREIRDFYREM
eukprot:SAG31_NODE_285_length_18479_cov_9.871980_22_plen_66_part_00